MELNLRNVQKLFTTLEFKFVFITDSENVEKNLNEFILFFLHFFQIEEANLHYFFKIVNKQTKVKKKTFFQNSGLASLEQDKFFKMIFLIMNCTQFLYTQIGAHSVEL